MNFLLPILLSALLVLSACGQTGQLELPPGFGDQKSDEKPDEKPTKKTAQ